MKSKPGILSYLFDMLLIIGMAYQLYWIATNWRIGDTYSGEAALIEGLLGLGMLAWFVARRRGWPFPFGQRDPGVHLKLRLLKRPDAVDVITIIWILSWLSRITPTLEFHFRARDFTIATYEIIFLSKYGLAVLGGIAIFLRRRSKAVVNVDDLLDDEWPQSYRIKPGSPDKWQPEIARGFVSAMMKQTTRYGIRFTIQATYDAIEFRIKGQTEEISIDSIQAVTKSYYPHAQVEMCDPEERSYPFQRHYGIIGAAQEFPFWEEIGTASDIRGNDPLALITQTMGNLQPGEVVEYIVEVRPPVQIEAKEREEFLTRSRLSTANKAYYLFQGAGGLVQMWFDARNKVQIFSDADQRRYIAKLHNTLYPVSIYVVFDSPNSQRQHSFSSWFEPIYHFANPKYPILKQGMTKTVQIKDLEMEEREHPEVQLLALVRAEDMRFYTQRFLFTADEVAALWHLPHDQFTAAKIQWPDTTNKQLPEALKNNHDGILIGNNHYGGDVYPVRLPDDDRTTHTLIIGKNGTGKSSLMHRMIHEDIGEGRGVCVIDPHGSLVSDILRASIPDNRIKDVVVLDLSMAVDGTRYPPPINPLYKVDNSSISNSFISTLNRIYDDFSTSQMAYLLSMALKTLGSETKPTLLDVQRLFEEDDYRGRLVGQVDSLNLQRQWSSFLNRSNRQRHDDTFPLFRRLDAFYDSNDALTVTCHPDPLNVYDLVRQNKIILVSVGATGNRISKAERMILGSSLVSQIEHVAMAGAINQPPFMLYIDETQTFINTPLDEMLAQVRKFGLGLVLANQFLAQLTDETQDAVEGNVGTMFSFEIGASDARAMQTYMTTFEREELTSLGKYRAAVSMRYKGQRQSAFTLETLPPPGFDLRPEEGAKREQIIRRRSVENYTPKTYDEVVKWLKENYGPGGPSTDTNNDDDDDNSPTSDGFHETPPTG